MNRAFGAAERGVGTDRLHRCRRTVRRPGGRPPVAGLALDTADGRPGRGPEWPYLLLLVAPWLIYGGALLLGHAQACLLCVPPLR